MANHTSAAHESQPLSEADDEPAGEVAATSLERMPNEIMATIVDMLPSSDLPSVSQVSGQLRSNAPARQWRIVDTEQALGKLLRYEPEKRQQFGGLIHELFIEVTEPFDVDRRAEWLSRIFSRHGEEQLQPADRLRLAYEQANNEVEPIKQEHAKLLELFSLDYPSLQKLKI